MQMSNTVNFKLDDDLYFELLALRVRLKAKGGWKGFVERIIRDYKQGNFTEPEKTVKESIQKNGSSTQKKKSTDDENDKKQKDQQKNQHELFNFGDDRAKIQPDTEPVRESDRPPVHFDVGGGEIISIPADEFEREKARMLERCLLCGHRREEHNLNGPGCYGDGDTCQCEGFVGAKS